MFLPVPDVLSAAALWLGPDTSSESEAHGVRGANAGGAFFDFDESRRAVAENVTVADRAMVGVLPPATMAWLELNCSHHLAWNEFNASSRYAGIVEDPSLCGQS